jgi:membrane protein YqaA with SNARE-associated domain
MPILEMYGKQDGFEELAMTFRDVGDSAVLIAALTPVPYKLVTITAGAMSMDFAPFIGASVLGRGLRFFAVAGLIYWKGEAISGFVEAYFERLMVAFAVLLLGGFAAVRLIL